MNANPVPARDDPYLAVECGYLDRASIAGLIGGSDYVFERVWRRRDRRAAARRARFAAAAVVDVVHLLRIADTQTVVPADGELFVHQDGLDVSRDHCSVEIRPEGKVTLHSVLRSDNTVDDNLDPVAGGIGKPSIVVGRRTGIDTFKLIAAGRRLQTGKADGTSSSGGRSLISAIADTRPVGLSGIGARGADPDYVMRGQALAAVGWFRRAVEQDRLWPPDFGGDERAIDMQYRDLFRLASAFRLEGFGILTTAADAFGPLPVAGLMLSIDDAVHVMVFRSDLTPPDVTERALPEMREHLAAVGAQSGTFVNLSRTGEPTELPDTDVLIRVFSIDCRSSANSLARRWCALRVDSRQNKESHGRVWRLDWMNGMSCQMALWWVLTVLLTGVPHEE